MTMEMNQSVLSSTHTCVYFVICLWSVSTQSKLSFWANELLFHFRDLEKIARSLFFLFPTGSKPILILPIPRSMGVWSMLLGWRCRVTTLSPLRCWAVPKTFLFPIWPCFENYCDGIVCCCFEGLRIFFFCGDHVFSTKKKPIFIHYEVWSMLLG